MGSAGVRGAGASETPRRLLVGVAQADFLDERAHPRAYLVEVLARLRDIGVEIQVAMFEDGPARVELERVADVRVIEPHPENTVVARLHGAARFVRAERLARRVGGVLRRDERRWIRPPDCVHLHGPLAESLLSYVPSRGIPVTVYAHPWDFSIAGLPTPQRDRLLQRADRFLAADDSVARDLVAVGVDPLKVERAPDPASAFPDPHRRPERRESAREALGLPAGAVVVAVPPVKDWVDEPDLTLGLAWELERLGAARAPSVLWYGMPEDDARRWPVDFEMRRMGLDRVRVVSDELDWDDLSLVADAVVLPLRNTGRSPTVMPAGFARDAAMRSGPLLFCWEGNDRAHEVGRWGGTVVRRGDVETMALQVWGRLKDPAVRREAYRERWTVAMAEVERAFPLGVASP